MTSLRPLYKFIGVGMLAAILPACSYWNPPPAQTLEQAVKDPEALQSTAHYMQESQHSVGETKSDATIKAASQLIEAGMIERAEQMLIAIPTDDLTPALRSKRQCLYAEMELYEQKPQTALRLLNTIDQSTLQSTYWRLRFHQLRARAHQQSGNNLASVKDRITIDALLNNAQAKKINRHQLWTNLHSLSLDQLTDAYMNATKGSILSGWLNLAMIYKEFANQPRHLVNALDRWHEKHAQHPASAFMPKQFNVARLKHPQRIALLLPLHGKLAKPAQALRDGFMNNYYLNNRKHPRQSIISVFDTSKGDIKTIYRDAIHAGADFVVGPLDKSNVQRLANNASIKVPTLSLNYITDSRTSTPANLYQFGLSPIDEAVQVAMKAHLAGHQNALIIAPQGEWGKAIVAAFTQQWQQLEGHTIAQINYQPKQGLNKAIRDALLIPQSTARARQVKRIIGNNKLKFIPRRRQDIDMVFMIASPKVARQVKPLLQFHYAGDIAVYATSSIYSGKPNSTRDRDLNGINFPDMPWILQSKRARPRYARLYALGSDAFKLSQQIAILKTMPELGIPGDTGELYMTQHQHISRKLPWAVFNNGIPKVTT